MKKIVGVIVIVGVFGAVTFCLHAGDALNDTELESIQGGASCQYCGSNGDGCTDEGGQEDNCVVEKGCEGTIWSSCLQAQQKCIDKFTTSSCSPTSPNCTGTYVIQDCTYGVDPNNVVYCYWKSRSASSNCSGQKTGC
jgi:hypothetical protein